MKQIVVFTGAGISAESGLATFRDSGGFWEKYGFVIFILHRSQVVIRILVESLLRSCRFPVVPLKQFHDR